jgi:membrane-bound lytic murein transglycosylase MltF
MNGFFLILIAAIGVFLGKDKVEDEITAASSSFTQFDDLFKQYGFASGVDWKWLKAICMNESSLGENASVKRGLQNPSDIEGSKSQDGKSWGLMQLTLATAGDYSSSPTVQDLNNPEFSIRVAARFISWLQKQFPSIESRYVEWVIKSYNQGRGNTAKERAGTSPGYAQAYWERFQRNLALINQKQGD